MNAARSLLVVVILLSCSCEALDVELDVESCGSVGGGEPYMPLDGTLQGKWVVSSTFQPNWTLELKEYERVEVRGTFKGDWAYHMENYRRPDTIRGAFHGDYCWPDIDFSFAWQAPNAQGAINFSCEFDGVTNDRDYFAGLTVCEHEGEPLFYVAPTYFERQCGPYDCDDG